MFDSSLSAQQPRQIGRLYLLQIGDRVNDFAAQLGGDMWRAQTLELARHRIPTHQSVAKAFIVSLFFREGSAVVKRDSDAARHLIGEPPAVIGRRAHADFAEQRLDVRTLDSFGAILFRHDLVVEDGDGYD